MYIARCPFIHAWDPVELLPKLLHKVCIGHSPTVPVLQVAHLFAAEDRQSKLVRLVNKKRGVEPERCVQLEPQKCTRANQVLDFNKLPKASDMRLGSVQRTRRQ